MKPFYAWSHLYKHVVVAWCLHEKQLFVQNTYNLMTMLTQVSCSFEVS